MLCPDRWPPTFGSGPACCSASPRVPPGGMTTASLNCASARKLRPFSGSCTTSRFSITSLISALARLQQRRFGGHGDLLGEPAHFHREVDRQRLSELQRHARTQHAAESAQLGGDDIGADAQRAQEIATVIVGDALDADAGVDMLGNDRRSRKDAALRVAHDAGDLSRIGLTRGSGRGDNEGHDPRSTRPGQPHDADFTPMAVQPRCGHRRIMRGHSTISPLCGEMRAP